jgi:hypothetical protein
MYHGPAGALVRLLEPHSEADPLAVLAQLLVAFGNCLGRTAHFRVERNRHYLNLFLILVGSSSKGRKGTAWGQVHEFFAGLDADWKAQRIHGGLSSGEGVIYAVRDPIHKREPIRKGGKVVEYQDVETDAGVADKRLLCLEPEFASVLRVQERQGNTLSPLLRQAWENGDLRTLTRNSPAKASGAHISIIGHVTADELRRYLSQTEQGNGFGNRFLWLQAHRSKVLPLGGDLDEATLGPLTEQFLQALAFGRATGEMPFDAAAREDWVRIYGPLSEGQPGLAGCLLARAEAQVRRLACVYALLDLCGEVRKEHLAAALALWGEVEQTVYAIFGHSTGDRLADEILEALQATPAGLSRSELYLMFQRNQSSQRITSALGVLLANGLAHRQKSPPSGRGRPEERWAAGPEPTQKTH